MNDTSAVKVTLEIGPGTNLNELRSHLSFMQLNIPESGGADSTMLADFTVHEGELAPLDSSEPVLGV